MGDIRDPGGTLCTHGASLAGGRLRRRPVSAPARRQDPLPGSSSPAGATNNNRRQQQPPRPRRRPETASGSGRSGGGRGGCWGRGGGRGAVDGHEKFECLRARLAKTVEGSSQFVDDIRRLRKAGGLRYDEGAGSASWGPTPRAASENARARAAGGGEAPRSGGGPGSGITRKGAPSPAFAPAPVWLAGDIEPLALAEELGVRTIVDRITRAIVHDDGAAEEQQGGNGARAAAAAGGGGGRRAGTGGGRGDRALEASSLTVALANNAPVGARNEDRARSHASSSSPPPPRPANQRQQLQFAGAEQPWGSGVARSFPPPPRSGGSPNRTRRPKEDIERLRRVVRDTMSSAPLPPPSSHSSTPLYGGIALAGGERWGGTHPPQWSQKHEACLADMRRRLRESGSPLLSAKDPAVLLGAILRRQGPLIRLLDEAVLSLEDIAEALNALVSVSTRLKVAGVSADALFTRAGIVKPGAEGALGHASTGSGAGDGRNNAKRAGGGGDASSKVRRCAIKRIHAEVNRVLGEVASFREFKTALSACVRGSGGRGGGGSVSSGGAGMEWITVDQLDHSLRTCHLTRRALDPQGASHPPLTGKRVARFLEEMEHFLGNGQPPGTAAVAATTAAGASPNAVNMLHLGNEHPQSLAGGASKKGAPARQRRQGRRAKMAQKRAGRKWNEEDRDLAERELAAVVVERQKKFVEGYVRERRRYLNRRVSAQREGHGGFQREKVPFGPGGRRSKKAMEAEKAEFSEAVARTKIVLKLLETKVAASSPPQPNGGVGNASGGFPTSAGNGNAGSEDKRSLVGARSSSKNARRGRRRPASAAAVATTATTTNKNNNSILPKTKQDRTGKRAGANDDQDVKRTMEQMLRTSTEAYSDRVGHHGGGAVRFYPNTGAAAGGGAPGGILAGRGGERGRMSAAAQTVQAAFRLRMFHRFVWAQAYLRSPAHAFGLFKRCLAVLRGADALAAGPSGGAPAAMRAASQGDASTDINSIDAWPEAPGFCLSLPHHVHGADPVFLRYIRWRRGRESSGVSFDEGGGSTPASAPAVGSPRLRTSSQEPPQLQQQKPPAEGAQLFEKEYQIRTAAVRSMLVNVRVPFLPGALDSAMEDLERTIAREGDSANAVIGGSSNRHGRDSRSRSDRDVAAPPENRSGKAAGGKPGQHGVGISFASWYGWWTRHLPFDPASTGCLLKTVRCAKALHAVEISAAAGKL